MGAKRKTIDMSFDADAQDEKPKKRVKVDIQEKIDEKIAENEEVEVKQRVKQGRSKRYVDMRRHVDKTKTYSLKKAVELLTKVSYSKFVGTVSADLNIMEDSLNIEIAFPHSTGKVRRVEIATDALLKKIEKGEIDFEILVASPDMMPKLAKFARTLGPKGLMPNPKNGTVSPDPKKRAAELAGGKVRIKSEKKHPLVHVVIGKVDQKPAELIANVERLIKVIDAKKIQRLTLSATMSPGIKIDLSKYLAK